MGASLSNVLIQLKIVKYWQWFCDNSSTGKNKQSSLTLSTRMLYWTSWPDNTDAVAFQLDKMIINA